MQHATVAILDFGSQYTQLIARRIRELQVHSMIVPPQINADALRDMNLVGIVLSGGPSSVHETSAPRCGSEILELGVPVMGICYGMQLLVEMLGGRIEASVLREFGRAEVMIEDDSDLFAGVASPATVWMSHGDVVRAHHGDFVTLASTVNCPIAAVRHKQRPIYGLQFHPEVAHTPRGGQMLHNFLANVCKAPMDWSMGNVVEEQVASIRALVREDERVICGLSGGVDSSVTAALLQRAVPGRLVCIYVDNGLMRRGETQLVEATFRQHFAVDLRVVRAGEHFLAELAGVTDPQEKRRRIGHAFIDVFRRQAQGIAGARFLAQGTLYPDVVESGQGLGGTSANIKLHHNVGGLPAELGFDLIEPLRDLFKDEVRRMGEHLDLPRDIVWRHPFPGPGMAVRIIGEVTPARVDLLQQVDEIVIDEVRAAGWYDKIGQAFAVLLPVSTVGVMGDGRTYAAQHIVAVRFVETVDYMTADWVRIDYAILERISTRVINEVDGVNRVVYDISSKPPATIEWE